jgi:hypothetical protein
MFVRLDLIANGDENVWPLEERAQSGDGAEGEVLTAKNSMPQKKLTAHGG